MNKIIKILLITTGITLTAYGVCQIIVPEASVDIGIVEYEKQKNKSGYITTGIGIVMLLIGFFVAKK